jgi:alpha-ketoglutarate-dependent taurine dioxygenase
MAVLSGDRRRPSMVFDADLMVGIDEDANEALRVLGEATQACHASVALESGDLLIVDNNVAVHGRSPFVARFDGSDRWLQRTFVVSDLSPSAADRRGRIITTHFGI